MGVLGFADTDLEAEMANDESAAEVLDREHLEHLRAVAADG
jgi:hypothetical protein